MCLELNWLSCNVEQLWLVHALLALICIKRLLSFTLALFHFEDDLKDPIPTSCSTCELHVVKNLELGQCVDRLQTQNDDL
jgi:hypothetical protein